MRQKMVSICIFLLLTVAVCADKKPAVGWMIYPYTLTKLTEEEYNRFLNCTEAEYLGLQVYPRVDYSDTTFKTRISELAAAGKKMVIQVWWGAGPPFSWERYNFPNIALNPEIRKEFFDRVIDPWIDYAGYKNIYAIHLLEETGMQFGWDISMPARPEKDSDGYQIGSNYQNPSNFLWSRSISGPNVLTIKRYNNIFKKETGLDMSYYPVWTPEEMDTYRRWVQQTMEAGAHIQFAHHVHRKYPGIKVYAFNSRTALIPQSRVLDGHFLDPYTNNLGLYLSLRGSRIVMRPEEELIAMMWGNRAKVLQERMPQQAVAYISGANILSTFGDKELQDEKWLNVVRDSVKPFLGLPVFQSKPRVLALSGPGFSATLRHIYFWITGFSHYDVCQPWAEEKVSLKPYELVFSWAGWHKDLQNWIDSGGTLVIVRPPSGFLNEKGYIEMTGKPQRKTFDYKPNEWMKKNFKLQDSYNLDLDLGNDIKILKDPSLINQDQFIYILSYGKGMVVIINALCYVNAPWKYEPVWEPYRQLLTDVCRGAMIYRNKKEIAEEYFNDPELGNDYFRAVSSDGRTTVYILNVDQHGPNKSKTSFTVPGRDRVTGKMNVKLSYENPVVIIEK